MSAERVTAWATLSARGEQTIHTTHGSLGAEDALSSLGGLDLVAAAVAVDVLQAFATEARRLSLGWSEAEANVHLQRGERPMRLTLVEYQVRVTTEEADLMVIASHQLEPHAPVLAALAAVAEHTGHVVMKRPDHR